MTIIIDANLSKSDARARFEGYTLVHEHNRDTFNTHPAFGVVCDLRDTEMLDPEQLAELARMIDVAYTGDELRAFAESFGGIDASNGAQLIKQCYLFEVNYSEAPERFEALHCAGFIGKNAMTEHRAGKPMPQAPMVHFKKGEETPEIEALQNMMDSWSELSDNRFAVIAEVHFDFVEYNGCNDGNDYQQITVYEAKDMHNASYIQDGAKQMMNSIIETYIFTNDIEGAEAKFVQLIAERMHTNF